MWRAIACVTLLMMIEVAQYIPNALAVFSSVRQIVQCDSNSLFLINRLAHIIYLSQLTTSLEKMCLFAFECFPSTLVAQTRPVRSCPINYLFFLVDPNRFYCGHYSWLGLKKCRWANLAHAGQRTWPHNWPLNWRAMLDNPKKQRICDKRAAISIHGCILILGAQRCSTSI